MKKIVFLLICLLSCFVTVFAQEHKFTRLIWNDEFNGAGLPDTTKWSYDIGSGGWGNQEAEFYTNRIQNAYQKDGNLIITAIKEHYKGSNYTSARLATRGKYEVKYGRIEVRAKIPRGLGAWPTFWMLGSNITKVGWPISGEVDILENFGYDSLNIHGTVHRGDKTTRTHISSGNSIQIENSSEKFHVYSIEWDSTGIDFYVDSIKYHSYKKNEFTNEGWPLDQPFFLLLNLAVGGVDGGYGIDDSRFPFQFCIDYVRVYQ